LVVSEINYPGWVVWVNGEKREIETAAGVLRAVKLESGRNEVYFAFQPGSLLMGLVLSIGGLFVIVLIFINQKQKELD